MPWLFPLCSYLGATTVTSPRFCAHLTIGKSPSYLSKLEGGGVRTIERDMLKDMLVFISGGADFYDRALVDASVLLAASEGGRFVDQAWFLQFDFIERPVVVPAGMSVDLAGGFSALGADAQTITDHINANLDSEVPPSFPANQAISLEYGGSYRFLVRTEFEKTSVDEVISGTDTQTTYYVAYNVTRALFRMQRFAGADSKLPPEDAVSLLRATAEYLERWGLRSLGGFERYLFSSEFVEYQLPLVNAQDGVAARVGAQLAEIAEHAALDAVGSLSVFSDTLDWDPAFAMKLLGMPFSSLGAMSYSNKKELIDEIGQLLARYAALDELDRKIERY